MLKEDEEDGDNNTGVLHVEVTGETWREEGREEDDVDDVVPVVDEEDKGEEEEDKENISTHKKMKLTVLVTGGCGYIGSHTVVELIQNGYDVVVLDNLSNSSIDVLDRVREITGVKPFFVQVDLQDAQAIEKALSTFSSPFFACLHFAGLKAVGESVVKPLVYYRNNVMGTLNLLHGLEKHHCKRLIFSSSATVYGEPDWVPIQEDAKTHPMNPYGQTKRTVEILLEDLSKASKDWHITILRYFNPIGAHPSGKIGEDPQGIPNNLAPYVARVAMGELPLLNIYGNDWDTVDGTPIRDYLHVVDLAEGHLAALKHMKKGYEILNLGTGMGHSVLEVLDAFETAADRQIPFRFVARRPGDVESLVADPSLAKAKWGWAALKDLEEMCRDHYRYQFYSTVRPVLQEYVTGTTSVADVVLEFVADVVLEFVI